MDTLSGRNLSFLFFYSLFGFVWKIPVKVNEKCPTVHMTTKNTKSVFEDLTYAEALRFVQLMPWRKQYIFRLIIRLCFNIIFFF